jgi:carbohydrate kinase (thermoresistant glucokinase family)
MIVVMGVSGVGKTTVGERLAARLDHPFLEGDRFHPPANIAKMRKGAPLDDDDRRPWLAALAAELDRFRRQGKGVVLTCSALRSSYRAILRGGHDDVDFVFLDGAKALVQRRLAARSNHFMPPGLLDSQFAALEAPGGAEHALRIAVDGTPDAIVDAVLQRLRRVTD